MNEPVSLIIAALVAGAAKTAGQSVSDAYQFLKNLLKQKFQAKKQPPLVQKALESSPQELANPDNQNYFKEILITVGADEDEKIIKAAQAVIDLVARTSKAPPSVTNYENQIKAENVVLQQGEHNQQDNTFNKSP